LNKAKDGNQIFCC